MQCFLVIFSFKYLASEKNHVHYRKEQNKNDKGRYRLDRGKR